MNEQPTNQTPHSELKWWEKGLALLPGVNIVADEAAPESVAKSAIPTLPAKPLPYKVLPQSRTIGVVAQGESLVDASQVAEVSKQRSSAVFAIKVLAQIRAGIEAQELALSQVLQLEPTALRRAAIASYLAVSQVGRQQIVEWQSEARKAAEQFDADLAAAIQNLEREEVTEPTARVAESQKRIEQIKRQIAELTAQMTELESAIKPALAAVETSMVKVERNRASVAAAIEQSDKVVTEFFELISAGLKKAAQ